MSCEFRYPDAVSPLYSYTPPDPLIGSGDGSIPGLEYQRTADGELVGNVRHPRRRKFVRKFRSLTYAEKAARDAFFDATRGLPFLYIDETLTDYVTVKAVGRSLGGDEEWETIEGDRWARTEELEETSDMPTIGDIAGDVRVRVLEFTGTEQRKAAVWPQPFFDALYDVDPKAYLGSDGEIYTAVADYSTITDEQIEIVLSAHPGAGVTVRVFCLAIHQ
jgi:hypothetical protein